MSDEKNLTLFQFESQEVRVVKDETGDPWFVAKDVCELYGIVWKGNETLGSIPDNWKGVRRFRTPGGEQELIVFNEAALYKLTFRSTKPDADRFTNWIAGEVIPSIRKTGVYIAPTAKGEMETLSPRTIKKIESTYRAAYRFGLTYGLEGNQLKLSAESLTLKATGYLPSRLLDAPALVAPTQDRLIGVKEIAPEVGVNERAVNPLLIQMGFQESYRDHKNKVQYNLLEPGKEYGVLLDVPNVNGGTPKQHIKWRRDVIPLVQDFLKKTGEKVLMLAENH